MLRSYTSPFGFGHRVTQGYLDHPCIVQEKVDGSQFSFGVINGELHCRSKNNEINLCSPEALFSNAVAVVKKLFEEGKLVEGYTYRGECLKKPKHNALAYDRHPIGHIIGFDINYGEECYLPYAKVKEEFDKLGLETVPLIYEGIVSGVDQLKSFLERVSILGGQEIEGVVLKNYDIFGPDKKVVMVKYVSEKFKEIHRKVWGDREHQPKQGDIIELITEQFRTPARWEKAIIHLREVGQITDTPKDIGPLLKEVSKDVLEECADEMKEQLFKWAWPQISRKLGHGLPQWYKDKLMAEFFDEAKATETDPEAPVHPELDEGEVGDTDVSAEHSSEPNQDRNADASVSGS